MDPFSRVFRETMSPCSTYKDKTGQNSKTHVCKTKAAEESRHDKLRFFACCWCKKGGCGRLRRQVPLTNDPEADEDLVVAGRELPQMYRAEQVIRPRQVRLVKLEVAVKAETAVRMCNKCTEIYRGVLSLLWNCGAHSSLRCFDSSEIGRFEAVKEESKADSREQHVQRKYPTGVHCDSNHYSLNSKNHLSRGQSNVYQFLQVLLNHNQVSALYGLLSALCFEESKSTSTHL